MALEVKQLTCPKCSAPLDLKIAGRSKSIICASCGSQIDLTSPDFKILGNVGTRPDPQVTQFTIGMKGKIGGKEYQIIGRVVYRDDEGDVWDEWLCLSAAGEYIWISDSENEGMAIWYSFTPKKPVDPSTLGVGQHLNLRDTDVKVRDMGRANIDFLEGELTWKASVNDKMRYAEVDGPSQRISIEYTENEIEFYWGRRLDRIATARAFGVPRKSLSIPEKPKRSLIPNINPTCSSWILNVIIAIIVIVLMIIAGNIIPAGSGSGGSSSSIRSGSSSSRSFGGGGGGGGGK